MTRTLRTEAPPVTERMSDRKQEAVNNLPEAVVGAYRVLVAVDETGQVTAQSLRADPSTVGGAPFERIKAMLAEEERLVTSTLDPDLILPGSYLELWDQAQTSRRVTDLIAAFGQFPRLPRLFSPESLYDTLARGVREGALALRLPRSDGSLRTWWRISPDADTLRRKEMEIQLKAAINQGKLRPVEIGASPDSLAGRVRLPDVALYGDATLDAALQSLAEQVAELLSMAPQLAFSFRVAITVEGHRPDEATLQRLNDLLEAIKPGWRLR